MKTNVTLGIVVMVLLLAVTGCGKEEIIRNDNTLSLEDAIAEATAKEEKYVYDYQVSMDPIPEEIAALGGEVCGTIHAYPVEIMIGLAQKEIEENPEWQKQNEENIEFLKQYLTKEHGGEYEIRPMTSDFSQDEFMMNEYMCTEMSTDKNFSITLYKNPHTELKENMIENDEYYYADDAKQYKEDIKKTLEQNWDDTKVYDTFCENVGDKKTLTICIAIFREEMLEYVKEQEKIIHFYEGLKRVKDESNNQFTLKIIITYFPIEYKDVITKQYQSDCHNNYLSIPMNVEEKLINDQELYARFVYSEKWAWNDENSLDNIVEKQREYFDNPYKLDYWR